MNTEQINKVIKEAVNRFLGWKLPQDFYPDAGISFNPVYNEKSPFGPMRHEPIGTNLFTDAQATEMFRHCLTDVLSSLKTFNGAEIEKIKHALECFHHDDVMEALSILSSPHVVAEPVAQTAEQKLEAAGVFKGMHGLRGLAEAQEFWDKQPYGTRLYYGDGISDYLHIDVLKSAVKLLDVPSPLSVEAAPSQKENFIRFTAHGKACVIEVRETVCMLADCEDKAAKIEVVQMTRADFEALPEFMGY